MPINDEGEMFEPVKNYLEKRSNCLESIESFVYDSHRGVPYNTGWKLNINDYCSNPDVYGIVRDKIFLCQGKLIKNTKGKLWEVIGQGISNRNYCNYLYIFFEKEYLEKIRKDKPYYQDFESILKHFNIGLLVINSDLQVEEIIQAKEQNAPKENINLTKEKISNALSSGTINKFLRTILKNLEKLGKKPYYLLKTYLQPSQPAFYIYLDEWQKDKDLKYFIKFLKKRVLIGINVSPELMQGGFINRLLTNPRFTFTEYNRKKIDDITNLKIESKNTQEFHESVQLNQNPVDFFSDLNSEKNKKITSDINKVLTEIIKIWNPDFLRTLF